MSINIQTLQDLKNFEDLCILPSAGPDICTENQVPPKKDFGTFKWKQIAIEQGFDELYDMLNTDFVPEFDMTSVEELFHKIENIKTDILNLSKDTNIIHDSGINKPVFPILYDINKDTPIYITSEELSPVQFKLQNTLYSQVDILPYADDIKDGLNYPEFSSVIENLTTKLIPKTSIIIQNVLGNGECLFRSLINGYHYSEKNVNLGFNPPGTDDLVKRMKNIFLQVLQFCLSDNKTQTIFNCSARFYQTFYELIQQEFVEKEKKLTFQEFKTNYLKPEFYGGPFECNLFSQLFNYRVNLFSRERENNKFTFIETFDNRVNKSRDNYGRTINVLNVGNHFMVIYL